MSYWISNYDQTGEIPKRAGQEGIGAAPNGTFETGKGYIYVAALSDAMFERLCNVLNRPDLIDDDRFRTMDERIENRDTLRSILVEEFRRFDADGLEETLLNAGIPAGAVRTVKEIVDDDPHVDAREMIVESYNPETSTRTKVPALPFRVDTNLKARQFSSAPPEKGEHTRQILRSLSYSEDKIKNLFENDIVV
jgi:crotonobetainyl-CoA:carnitine CoA-transferase CaiB-like acyl-CoA transferase